MALVKCADCGMDVSSRAAACPRCAAPVGLPVVPGVVGLVGPARAKAAPAVGRLYATAFWLLFVVWVVVDMIAFISSGFAFGSDRIEVTGIEALLFLMVFGMMPAIPLLALVAINRWWRWVAGLGRVRRPRRAVAHCLAQFVPILLLAWSILNLVQGPKDDVGFVPVDKENYGFIPNTEQPLNDDLGLVSNDDLGLVPHEQPKPEKSNQRRGSPGKFDPSKFDPKAYLAANSKPEQAKPFDPDAFLAKYEKSGIHKQTPEVFGAWTLIGIASGVCLAVFLLTETLLFLLGSPLRLRAATAISPALEDRARQIDKASAGPPARVTMPVVRPPK